MFSGVSEFELAVDAQVVAPEGAGSDDGLRVIGGHVTSWLLGLLRLRGSACRARGGW